MNVLDFKANSFVDKNKTNRKMKCKHFMESKSQTLNHIRKRITNTSTNTAKTFPMKFTISKNKDSFFCQFCI